MAGRWDAAASKVVTTCGQRSGYHVSLDSFARVNASATATTAVASAEREEACDRLRDDELGPIAVSDEL